MSENPWEAMTDTAIVRDICRSIKQLRINKNISQQEIAARSGLDRTTISRLEGGQTVTLLTLVQVLRALDRLELLDIFRMQQQTSPIKLLQEEEKKRTRAGRSKKILQQKPAEDAEW